MMRFSLICVSTSFLASLAHATPIRLQIKGPEGKPVVVTKMRVAAGCLPRREQSFSPERDFTGDANGVVAFVSQVEIVANSQDINQTRLFVRVTVPGLAVAGVQLKLGSNTVTLSRGQSLEGATLDENEKPAANVRLAVGIGSLKFEGLPQKGWADVQVRDDRFENEKFALDLSQKALPLFMQSGTFLSVPNGCLWPSRGHGLL